LKIHCNLLTEAQLGWPPFFKKGARALKTSRQSIDAVGPNHFQTHRHLRTETLTEKLLENEDTGSVAIDCMFGDGLDYYLIELSSSERSFSIYLLYYSYVIIIML